MKLLCVLSFIVCLDLASKCVFGACRFGAHCTFPCHCAVDEECDQETGECQQCHQGYYRTAWDGPGCQIGNLAFHKPVIYSLQPRVIDRTNHKLVDGSNAQGKWLTGVTKTATIDLLVYAAIHRVYINNRAGPASANLQNARILLHNTTRYLPQHTYLCGRITQPTGGVDDVTVQCDDVRVARFVTLIKDREDGSTRSDQIAVNEIEVIGYLVAKNMALNKPATQSKDQTYPSGPYEASLAVDASVTSGITFAYAKGENPEDRAWWKVDFGRYVTISRVDIIGDHEVRTDHTNIFVTNSSTAYTDVDLCGNTGDVHHPTARKATRCSRGAMVGRYLVIERGVHAMARNRLSLHEVYVYDNNNFEILISRDQINQTEDVKGFESQPQPHYAIDRDVETKAYCYKTTGAHAWWRVDLEGVYTVENVKLLGSLTSRASDFTGVYLSDTEDDPYNSDRCGESGNIYGSEYETSTGPCDANTHGRYITLRRDRGVLTDQLQLKEVLVMVADHEVCPVGTYGPGCLETCNCTLSCHVVTGSCIDKCPYRRTGYHCKDCAPGYGGPYCEMPCTKENHFCSSITVEPPRPQYPISPKSNAVVGKGDSDSTMYRYMYLAAGGVALLLLAVLVIVCTVRCRRKKKPSPADTELAAGHHSNPAYDAGPSAPPPAYVLSVNATALMEKAEPEDHDFADELPEKKTPCTAVALMPPPYTTSSPPGVEEEGATGPDELYYANVPSQPTQDDKNKDKEDTLYENNGQVSKE